jgi:hypothetical protein
MPGGSLKIIAACVSLGNKRQHRLHLLIATFDNASTNTANPSYSWTLVPQQTVIECILKQQHTETHSNSSKQFKTCRPHVLGQP